MIHEQAAAHHRGNRRARLRARPVAEAAGHELAMPATRNSTSSIPPRSPTPCATCDGVLHLATRIRSLEQISDPDAWRENDRLRADASRILVDAAIAAGAEVYVQPTVTFVYPPNGPVSEDTPGPRRPADPALRARRRAAGRALRAAPADAASSCDLGSSTARAPGSTSRWATSAPRCTSPMPGARSSRRCRCPAASTTSAATASVSRPTASPRQPDGIRRRRFGVTCCGRCTALVTPSCFRTPGTWPRREPWSRLGFPWSRPPAAAWPPRSAMRTTRVRRATRCSPRPRGSHGASTCP